MLLEVYSYAILLFLTSLLLLRFATTSSSKSQPKGLGQIPGPTALPIIGHIHHLRNPLLHRSFHNLAAKYGPLFYLRVGAIPAIVVTTPELAKEFLKNYDLEFACHTTTLVIQHLAHDAAFTFSPHGTYWKLLRKLCVSEFLGNRVVSQFLPIRFDETKCFLRDLLTKAKLGEHVNFTKEVTKLTTNILSRMMMGVRCSGTEEGAKEALIVHEVAQIVGQQNLADVFPIFKYFDVQGIKKKCEDIHKRYDAMLEKIMVKREELRMRKRKLGEVNNGENGVKDFLDILYDVLENENAEMRLTRNHIKGLILDFFTAGTDTSATSLEWTLAELINNPKIMKKAQEEIDHVIGKERIVTELDTPNLLYIQALIKETLRLHAPIPMFVRKAMQDCIVMGFKIPADTFLFINVYSMARDPNHWENPLEFRPERFLNDDSTSLRDVKGKDFELLPFGTGRRGCPGMTLALQELHATTAAIVQCFDWKVTSNNGVVEMDERPGLSVPRAHDLVCVPSARIDNLDSIITYNM